jgi:peptidyl-prolyl cis-trans isomerase D
MLDVIRTHAQSWIAKVILALITVPFALWGIDSYFRGGGQTATVASVGSSKITEHEYLQALNSQRDGIISQGGKVDIDNPAFRKQVLDQLIDSRLVSDAALGNGMMITAEQVGAMLMSIPAFQQNGQYSRERLESWLRARHMSEQDLLNMIQQDALMQQLQFGYGEGSVAPTASVEYLVKQLAQQREVNELVFSAKSYLPGIKIDDQSVAAEYKANQASYSTPQQARIQYVVLSLAGIASQTQVSDEAVKQFYEANKARFQEPEQRRASHILIKTESGMTPTAKAEAKAKAEKLLQELRANPGKFADLAKQHSGDPGSAARGGDLGNFSRDMMVKPFADAAFSLKTGEMSSVVESEFGYHIIRLDGITPGSSLGLAVVKNDIVNEIKNQEAQRKYAEMADRFSNLVYEKPDSLAPAAKELGLSVAESGWISQNRAEPALLMNPALLAAVFAPEAVSKKQNTEAIEVGSNTLVAAHVIEYKPAGVLPLAEVSQAIRDNLAGKAARAKAIEAGKAALAAAQGGQAPSGMGMPVKITRMQPAGLPPQAMKVLFKVNAAKLPGYAGVEMPDGYRLYRVNQVTQGTAQPGLDQQIKRDLNRMVAQEELRAYLEYARARNKIDINQALVEKKAN